MTIETIFQELANHMIEGTMLHQQLIHYYDFLHLQGYSKCHEYHYLEQDCGYRKLCHYFIEHYNKLIELQTVKRIDIIPSLWYRHKREDVDTQLKRQAIEKGMEIWVSWQKDTKEFYQKKFQELMQLGQIAAAMFFKDYICDVDNELKCAEGKFLDLKAVNYDIVMILEKQQEECKKYKKKIAGGK